MLVDNFNNISNLQGTGTTIVGYRPSTETDLPRSPSCRSRCLTCPGGVGLSTAMTMLKTGWIIVGSTPSKDGTTATKGDGCLLVLDPNGAVAAVWKGANIVDPWGDMAVIDNGADGDAVRQHGGQGPAGRPMSSIRRPSFPSSATRPPCFGSA